jgi:hypothetical protein
MQMELHYGVLGSRTSMGRIVLAVIAGFAILFVLRLLRGAPPRR